MSDGVYLPFSVHVCVLFVYVRVCVCVCEFVCTYLCEREIVSGKLPILKFLLSSIHTCMHTNTHAHFDQGSKDTECHQLKKIPTEILYLYLKAKNKKANDFCTYIFIESI